jgi:hypothetical protein
VPFGRKQPDKASALAKCLVAVNRRWSRRYRDMVNGVKWWRMKAEEELRKLKTEGMFLAAQFWGPLHNWTPPLEDQYLKIHPGFSTA